MYQKKFNKDLTVNYISYVDQGLIKISNLFYGAPDWQGAGNKLPHPSPNLHCGPVLCLLLPSRLFLTVSSYTKTILQEVMTRIVTLSVLKSII